MEQVAMCHVQFNYLESGVKRPTCCGAELGFDLIQFGKGQGTGNGMTYVKGNVAWSKRLPAACLHPQGATAEPRQ